MTEAGFSMNSSVPTIRYEVQRMQRLVNENDQVAFWCNALQFGLAGVETANQRLGPFLKLKDWSRDITHDMGQFERPFRVIYRRHFKRKAQDPYMQIAMTILFSMVLWHFGEIKTQVFGGPDRSRPTPTSTASGGDPDISPPPGEAGARNFKSSKRSNGVGTLGNIFKMFLGGQ